MTPEQIEITRDGMALAIGKVLDAFGTGPKDMADAALDVVRPYLGYRGEIDEQKRRADKLQAFKDWVHNRLDQAGVPADPDPESNKSHGCRISGRFTWLFKKLAEAEKERDFGTLLLGEVAGYVMMARPGWCFDGRRETAVEWVKDCMATLTATQATLTSTEKERDAALARVRSLEDTLDNLNERNP